MRKLSVLVILVIAFTVFGTLPVQAQSSCYIGTASFTLSVPAATVTATASSGSPMTVPPSLVVGPVFYTGTNLAAGSYSVSGVFSWNIVPNTGGLMQATDSGGNPITISPFFITYAATSCPTAPGSPQAVLSQPNVVLPPEVIGGVAATTLPFNAPSGSANTGATEIWSASSGQKVLNIPAGALAGVAPGTELYPALTESELAALGIELYRNDDFTLVYEGEGKCTFTFRIDKGATNSYTYLCDTASS